MKAEWKVEGSGPSTRIVAVCSACKTGLQFTGSIDDARRLKLQHCGLVEKIPAHIWEEYRDKKFDPNKAE